MAASSSSSSPSAEHGSSPMLPTKRRLLLGRPLHPVNRGPPAVSPFHLSSSGVSPEDTVAAPSTSVSTAPAFSRKRSLYATSTVSPSSTIIPSLTESSLNSHIDRPSQHSNSTSLVYHQSPSYYPQSANSPMQAPHGEFSFHTQDLHSEQRHGDRPSVKSSSIAFAKLAQAQRAQQEAQGRNGSGKSTKDHLDGPAAKRRKGVTGILVDSALSAAIYTGAAAVTAYSIWSSWGSKRQDQSLSSADENVSPGGMGEPPPPPYVDHSNASGPSVKMPLSPPRSGYVYVSSRRRRPAFYPHRSLRANVSKLKTTTTTQPRQPVSTPVLQPSTAENQRCHDGDMDGDDTFARMQLQMANLIEEGNRALQSQALLDIDDQSSTPQSMQTAALSPARPSNLPVSPPGSSSTQGSEAWPYSRIPRLSTTSSRHSKSRY